MANERLRAALLQRGVTPDDLADHVGVDRKTIERWIGGRVPYRRHRYKVATRLGIEEAYLWPGALAAEQVASATESEIIVTYPHRWMVPREVWGQLFDSAEEEIGILVYVAMFIIDDPGLLALLRRKAEQGVRVRILLGEPDAAEVAARGEQEGIDDSLASKIRNAYVVYRPLKESGVEINTHGTVLYNSVFRADGELLVNSHIYGFAAAQAPAMHLRQVAGGTMVSTYLESFERVWAESRPLE